MVGAGVGAKAAVVGARRSRDDEHDERERRDSLRFVPNAAVYTVPERTRVGHRLTVQRPDMGWTLIGFLPKMELRRFSIARLVLYGCKLDDHRLTSRIPHPPLAR